MDDRFKNSYSCTGIHAHCVEQITQYMLIQTVCGIQYMVLVHHTLHGKSHSTLYITLSSTKHIVHVAYTALASKVFIKCLFQWLARCQVVVEKFETI
jgi:hypothetical protein